MALLTGNRILPGEQGVMIIEQNVEVDLGFWSPTACSCVILGKLLTLIVPHSYKEISYKVGVKIK